MKESMMEEEEVSQDSMKKLIDLAEKQKAIQVELDEMEEKRKKKQEELEKIQGGWRHEGLLPSLLLELGMKEFTLEDGSKVTVTDELKPPSMSATGKMRPKVLGWLRKNGHKALIKGDVSVKYSPGDERLEPLVEYLEEMNLSHSVFETVAAGTLASFFKEMLEREEYVPMEELKILQFRQSKVKMPAPKKASKDEKVKI